MSLPSRINTGLDEYTEYEFQVLASTSIGDGPKSSIKYERTKEDGKRLAKPAPHCIWSLAFFCLLHGYGTVVSGLLHSVFISIYL